MTARRSRVVGIDRSPSSLVVYCTVCTGWSDIATTERSAYAIAIDHEIKCHPGEYGIRNAAARADRRRGDAQ